MSTDNDQRLQELGACPRDSFSSIEEEALSAAEVAISSHGSLASDSPPPSPRTLGKNESADLGTIK